MAQESRTIPWRRMRRPVRKIAFHWTRPDDWVALVAEAMLHEERDKLVSILPDYVVDRESDLISDFWNIYEHVGDAGQLKEEIPEFLRSVFTHFRFFHGCRPLNVETYYDRGIEISNVSELHCRFRNMFLGNPRFPSVTEQDIRNAIDSMNNAYRVNGFLYLGLDDRFMIRDCGPYIIYGSEYIQALARSIGSYCVDSELVMHGVPTVFEIDVPIERLDDQDLFELGEIALHQWMLRILYSAEPSRLIDFSLELTQGIPSSCIVGHYHPENVPDPLRTGFMYQYKKNRWVSNPNFPDMQSGI